MQCSSLTFSQSARKNTFFSANSRLQFGNRLFFQKDYLRAIDEYQSYISTVPNDTVKFKIAFSYSAMGNSMLAENNFKELFKSPNLSDYSKIYYARENLIMRNLNYFDLNIQELSQLFPRDSNFIYNDNFQMMRNFALLIKGKTHQKSADFLQPFPSTIKEDAEYFYSRKVFPNNKSGTVAGIFSAIIPGSGKIYAGKTGDGITAFIVTGVLAFLAADNFNANHQGRAWLFTGLASAFYAGNIYGSVIAAQQYNLGIKISFENDVNLFLKKHNYFAPKPKFLFH